MNARLALAGALVIALAAGAYAFWFQAPEVPAFVTPAETRWHLRPFDSPAWVDDALPPSQGWHVAAYEAAFGAGGVLEVALLDRAQPLWEDAQARGAGVEIVVVGVRRLAPGDIDALPPAEREAAEATDDSGLARDAYAWRVVRAFTAAGGETQRVEAEGIMPPASRPQVRAEIGAGVLVPPHDPGFLSFEAGASVTVRDWITMGRMFKPFERRFERLPDEVDLGDPGGPVAVSAYPSPLWRVRIGWGRR